VLVILGRICTPLYTMAIVVLSLIPGNDVPLESISDKYRHAAAYGVFAILLSCSFLKLRWWAVPVAFALATVMGILMELVQPSFGRTRDLFDAIANSTGAAIGCVAISLIFYLTRALRASGQNHLTDPATNT
jgi:VanZ family protein